MSTVKELKALCKKKGIKGYSQMNKSQLLKAIKKKKSKNMKGGTRKSPRSILLDKVKEDGIVKNIFRMKEEMEHIDKDIQKKQLQKLEESFMGLMYNHNNFDPDERNYVEEKKQFQKFLNISKKVNDKIYKDEKENIYDLLQYFFFRLPKPELQADFAKMIKKHEPKYFKSASMSMFLLPRA